MNGPSADRISGSAIIDGVDVDAVAAAVDRCAGVAGRDSGRYRQVASYLPGRIVAGVMVGGGRVRVQIRARWGVPAPNLAAAITRAVAPLAGRHPVDVAIADIEDPPGSSDRRPDRAGRRPPD
jgi:hypothetical protein